MLCVYLIVWTRPKLKVYFACQFYSAHTHTRVRTHTHFSLENSVSRADCAFNYLLSNMSNNLVTVKTAFYNNRQTIDLILMLSFGQGGTNARRCEGKEVVLEETRL